MHGTTRVFDDVANCVMWTLAIRRTRSRSVARRDRIRQGDRQLAPTLRCELGLHSGWHSRSAVRRQSPRVVSTAIHRRIRCAGVGLAEKSPRSHSSRRHTAFASDPDRSHVFNARCFRRAPSLEAKSADGTEGIIEVVLRPRRQLPLCQSRLGPVPRPSRFR